MEWTFSQSLPCENYTLGLEPPFTLPFSYFYFNQEKWTFFFLEAILHQRDTAIQWSCIPPICPLKVIFWCSEEKGRAPGRTSLHGEDSAVGHIQLAASGSVSTAYKYWKNIFSFSSAASPQVRFWKSAISATSPPVGVWSSETFLELKLAQKPWGWIAFY